MPDSQRSPLALYLTMAFRSSIFIVNMFANPQTFPGVTRGQTKNLGPICSAVLTFMGYKQTDKQSIYIDYAFRAPRAHLLFKL